MGHTQAEDRMQRSSGGAIFRDQAPGHRAGNESGGREEPEQPESASGWGSLPHRVLSWGPSSWWLPPATVSLKGSSISLADAVMLAFLFIQNSRLFNFSYCSNWNIKKKLHLYATSKKPHLTAVSFFLLSFPHSNKTETLLFYAIRAPRLWEGLPGFTGKEFGSEKPVSLPLLLPVNPWQWFPNKTSFPFLILTVDQIIS